MNPKDRLRKLTYSFDSRKVMEATIIPGIERLERELSKAREDALDKCVAACKGEKILSLDATKPLSGVENRYNQAVDDCIEAITRALGERV